MSDQWYYRIGGEVVGPVSFNELRQAAAERMIAEDTPIRRGVAGEWIPASEVAGVLAESVVASRPLTELRLRQYLFLKVLGALFAVAGGAMFLFGIFAALAFLTNGSAAIGLTGVSLLVYGIVLIGLYQLCFILIDISNDTEKTVRLLRTLLKRERPPRA